VSVFGHRHKFRYYSLYLEVGAIKKILLFVKGGEAGIIAYIEGWSNKKILLFVKGREVRTLNNLFYYTNLAPYTLAYYWATSPEKAQPVNLDRTV